MARKAKAQPKGKPQSRRREVESRQLVPPPGGAAVRMYRTGHGDCFLLAFDAAERPVYVLIDCGYKPGSPHFLPKPTTVAEITADLRSATGNGELDIAVITHEHQDHVNGISNDSFRDLSIGHAWFAWTEDPNDAVANQLRIKYKDTLNGLVSARNRLAAAGSKTEVERVNALLELELGQVPPLATPFAVAAMSSNKRSMEVFKNKARFGPRYLRPHDGVVKLDRAPDVRVYVMGPPRDQVLLKDLDPRGSEEFHGSALASRSAANYFATAATGHAKAPFAPRYFIQLSAAPNDPDYDLFFLRHYGTDASSTGKHTATQLSSDRFAILPDDTPGRRIDTDWLASAEQLAIDMSRATNNSSLVLAFELGIGGKVLLFAADAQRGNWLSWDDHKWSEGDRQITAKDLLSRTVLYKVGHHGSHNATLNGRAADTYPCLGWMGCKDQATRREFTAMITAVNAWATQPHVGWEHPLPAIKSALLEKSRGKVLQTDTDLTAMTAPEGTAPAEWAEFLSKAHGTRLYFDYMVAP